MQKPIIHLNGTSKDAITILSQDAPIVCVRAKSAADAERIAAEDLGVDPRRVIAARVCTTKRRAGRWAR